MKVKVYNRQKIVKLDIAKIKIIVSFVVKNELSLSKYSSRPGIGLGLVHIAINTQSTGISFSSTF